DPAARPRAGRTHRRRSRLLRRREPARQEPGGDAPPAGLSDRDDPAGSDGVLEPGDDGWGADRRDPRPASRPARPGARRAGRRAPPSGADQRPGAAGARLSAPDERWYPPARRGRHRDLVPAEPPDRR